MRRSFVFLVFILIGIFQTVLAKTPGNIKIYMVLVNSFDGNQIMSDFQIKVFMEPSGKEIKPTSNKKESYYEVPEGKSIKVIASAVGFYEEQKVFETNNVLDGDMLEMQLNPKPSGGLVIRTIDAETKDPVASELFIVFFSRKNKLSINEQSPQANYFYEQKGKYSIYTTATGYLNDARELDLDISADSKIQSLVIELVKNRLKQEVEIFDKSTNSKVNSGIASVTHVLTGQKVFEGKIVDGKIAFIANRNEDYILSTKSEGFTDLKEPFTLDGSSKKFGLSPNSSLQIDIYDDETNERMGLEIEIVSPTGKKFKVITMSKTPYTFIPEEKGTYTIESKAKGYINRTGTFNIKSMSAGNTFYTLRLKKGSNEYVIKVYDIETKNPINNAMIKVFNEQSREIQGKALKNEKTVNLDVEKKHFFEVSATGYFDYTANIGFDRSVQVYMKKLQVDSLASYTIQIIDSQTLLPIKDARIRVFENTSKAIALSFDSKNSLFKTDKINPKLKYSYSYELSAKNYTNLREQLNISKSDIVINLSPFDIKTYYFKFIDGFTKKDINVDFKLLVDEVEIKNEKEGDRIKASMSTANNYKIELNKVGYTNLSKIIDKREAKENEFVIPLMKEKYEVFFKINNDLRAVNSKSFVAKIKNKQKNDSEKLAFDEAKGGFMGEINPEGSYLIQVESDDFEPFSTAFMLSQANPETMEYVLTLKPKKKEPEMKIEPVVEKPIAKIETPKKETIPEAPKVEVAKEVVAIVELKKGVKYPLEGVNFEKSKTTLVSGAEVKLDEIVNYLKTNPNFQVEIVGHTDNEGSDQRLNQRLSEFRAKVVANYLFNKGISPERMTTLGKGSSEPLVANDTDENKAKNRRIEILVLED
ncbi:OmpA family protein [Lacihabitans sp. LS3-19]|uniref:OmpA family protein n=1 Tax=Lacihabitans sp. LS3-19 TaxID=2487335 RepID=UPI0020CC416C|nr:OmpA family protein [Lacihabitans sp. LS3-19]MCP9769958.1 OmpA family protein [Lacihabitans sp. LS3-19]